jgi:hypothetical protein
VANVPRNAEQRFGDNWMEIRQQLKAVTYIVEFLSFLQNAAEGIA